MTAARYRIKLPGPCRVALAFLRSRKDSVQQLEEHACRSTGRSHAIAVPMARTGLYLAFKQLANQYDEIITAPVTIPDVINMMVCAGLRPVFIDIDPETSAMALTELQSELSRKTRPVLLTHLHGIAARPGEVEELCRRYKAPLVEDAAQAFGTISDNRPCGTFGDTSVLSFNLFKNITSIAGGLVLTDSDSLAESIRADIAEWEPLPLSWLAMRYLYGIVLQIATSPLVFTVFTYWIFRFASLYDVRALQRLTRSDLSPKHYTQLPDLYKSSMRPLQAELVLAIWRDQNAIDKDRTTRQAKGKQYVAALSDLESLQFPFVHSQTSNFLHCPVLHADREALMAGLLRSGRDIGPTNLVNCAALPAFKAYKADCPQATRFCQDLLYLPTYPTYPDTELAATISAVRQYCEHHQ